MQNPPIQIMLVHFDNLGPGEAEQQHAVYDFLHGTLVALSSIIAVRGVTLPDIKYVLIHLESRKILRHQSGCDVLGDELVDAELLSNMGGRAGRMVEELVFYLFELDDSVEALAVFQGRRRPPRQVPRAQHRTLVIGPPSRLAYVKQSMQHLDEWFSRHTLVAHHSCL